MNCEHCGSELTVFKATKCRPDSNRVSCVECDLAR